VQGSVVDWSFKSGKINLFTRTIRRKRMPAPEIISKLVQQFNENLENHKLVYALYSLTDEEISIVEVEGK